MVALQTVNQASGGQLTARIASCKLFELCGFRCKEAPKSRLHGRAIQFRSIACVDRVA